MGTETQLLVSIGYALTVGPYLLDYLKTIQDINSIMNAGRTKQIFRWPSKASDHGKNHSKRYPKQHDAKDRHSSSTGNSLPGSAGRGGDGSPSFPDSDHTHYLERHPAQHNGAEYPGTQHIPHYLAQQNVSQHTDHQPPAELDPFGDNYNIKPPLNNAIEVEGSASASNAGQVSSIPTNSQVNRLHRSTDVPPVEAPDNQVHCFQSEMTSKSAKEHNKFKNFFNRTSQTGPNNAEALIKGNDPDERSDVLSRQCTHATLAQQDIARLEQKVRNALQANMKEKDVNILFKKEQIGGALDTLIEQYKQALGKEVTLLAIRRKLSEALRDVPHKDLDNAYSRSGHLGLLELLTDDYLTNKSSQSKLLRVQDQLKKSGHNITEREVEEQLTRRGPEEALKFVLESYQSSLEAEREIHDVREEIKKAAKEIIPLYELNRIMRQYGAPGTLNHLVTNFWKHIRELESKVAAASARSDELDDELYKLKKETAELQRRDGHHRAAIANLESDHSAAQERLRKDFEKQAAEYRMQLETRDNQRQDSLREAEKAHEAQLAEFRRMADQRIGMMQADFAAKEREARQVELAMMEKHENLKGLLVKRDHFKGMSDPEISDSFKALSKEIDTFSRLQWEKRKEGYWPLSESTLRRSENHRKLKQHIVQSAVWIVLNDMIFRSPFQMFGAEGQKLHDEWTEKFGNDRRSEFPDWPEATEDSEKWRYELAKACLDAVKKAGGNTSTEKRWKAAHEEAVDKTTDAIYRAVEQIAAPDSSDQRAIHDFVTLATKFWLEAASQRCRILLVFPPDGTNALVGRKAPTSLQLVIQPEVRRKGNVQGRRLDMEQVVKGCEGEKTVFRTR